MKTTSMAVALVLAATTTVATAQSAADGIAKYREMLNIPVARLRKEL